MSQSFVLSPRYHLEHESCWLKGIDPARHYWIFVNGSELLEIRIPGLATSSVEEWKTAMLAFRALQPQESIKIERSAGSCKVYCVSSNCYAIEGRVQSALVWHLFDREAIESLLMSSHPDWLPSPKDLDLGRSILARAFAQPAYVY